MTPTRKCDIANVSGKPDTKGRIFLINKLKELREAKGLTQKEVGAKVGVSRQAINAIETGKFDPSIWLAYDLSNLFEMSIEELFDFERSERK